MTEPVTGLSLRRDDVTVKLYKPQGVPEDFAVRVDETKRCTFEIPAADLIETASEVALHLRTWHGWDGHHEPLRINEHMMPVDGKNHFYDYDLLTFPTESLHSGTNEFVIHSKTKHHMLEVLWPGPAIVAKIPKDAPENLGRGIANQDQSFVSKKSDVEIISETYQDRSHFRVKTTAGEYWLDKNSGGLSRLIDSDGKDWIAFKMKPWGNYPDAAASSFRGIPNLLFGGDESGFGHPGWDRGTSTQVDDRTIVSKSDSGMWELRWTFSAEDVRLQVATMQVDRKYWFLYEGPLAGRFEPSQQYFASDQHPPQQEARDYQAGQRIADTLRWAYFGDQASERVLYIVHETADDQVDTFSYLGSTDQGLESADGMVVFGFGRGPKGIDPLLQGPQSFRFGFLEQSGKTNRQYKEIRKRMDSLASQTMDLEP